jgi:hypothetical protein
MASSRNHVLKAMTGIAAAGSNSQSGSTQLGVIHPVKHITTVSTSSRGVRLPTITNTTDSTGLTLFNCTAVNCKVYPATGASIQGGSANAAFTLTANTGSIFQSDGSANWRVIKGG